MLADGAWQAQAQRDLALASARLATLLAPLGGVSHCALFVTVTTAHASALFEHLARQAILVRHFPAHGLLRFGLPGGEAEWQRLGSALANWSP